MEYTKGKWKLSGGVGAYDYTISSEEKYPIIRMLCGNKADAILATAAPELYEALKIAYEWCWEHSTLPNDKYNILELKIITALAKAEGKNK